LRCYRNAAIRVLFYPALAAFSMGTLEIGIAGEQTDAVHVTGASKDMKEHFLYATEHR
jgi:hypothetical protein